MPKRVALCVLLRLPPSFSSGCEHESNVNNTVWKPTGKQCNGKCEKGFGLAIYYHRITEWVRLEGISGCHQVQPPCFKQNPVERIIQGCVQSFLKTSSVLLTWFFWMEALTKWCEILVPPGMLVGCSVLSGQKRTSSLLFLDYVFVQ